MVRFKRQLMGEAEVKMDLSGSEVIPDNQGGLLLMGSGSDGAAYFLKVNSSGELITNASGSSATLSGAVEQGVAGTQDEGWFVRITDGTQILGTSSSAPLFVSGTVALQGGDVNIGNFPAVQTVTGVVDIVNPIVIGNFPVTQAMRIVDEPVQVFFDFPIGVTGTVDATIVNFPSVTEITGTVALEGGDVTVGNFPTTQSILLPPGPNATVTGFTASLVSTELLAENPDRKLCHFYLSASSDETSLACWVLMGTGTASPTNFSFMMFPHDSYEIPERALTLPFQAAFNVTTGSARLQVSEVT